MRALLAWSVLAPCLPVAAQCIRFEVLTTAPGLSDNAITVPLQDRDGLLGWAPGTA